MQIKNNIIKEYLKNVYFVTGTPCGGKTTISRALAEKYEMPVYDVDAEFAKHQSMANCKDQPAMCKQFSSADDFLLRPYKEYAKWLQDNTREQLDFIILDLIRLSQKQKIICDLHLTIEEANEITDSDHIVFLLKKPENIVEGYCNRADHDDFKQFVNQASDLEKAKENVDRTLKYLNMEKYEEIRKSAYFWIERDESSTVEAVMHQVEVHFRFLNILSSEKHILI